MTFKFCRQYLESYIESVEVLPLEIQRRFTLWRELDFNVQGNYRKLERLLESFCSLDEKQKLSNTYIMKDQLAECLRLETFKQEIITEINLLVDSRYKKLEKAKYSYKESCLSKGKESVPLSYYEKYNRELKQRKKERIKTKESKRSFRNDSDARGPAPSKRSKKSKTALGSMTEELFCFCRRISYGDMVGCDNEKCPFEWFHFNCVGLTDKPKGKWYCSHCTEKMALKL